MTPRVMPLNVCTLAILLSLYLRGVHSALTHDPTRHCAAANARHLHNVVAHLHTHLQLLLLRVLLCHCSLRPTRSFLAQSKSLSSSTSPTGCPRLLALHTQHKIVCLQQHCGYWFAKEGSGAQMGGNERLAGANVLFRNGGTLQISEHIFAINQKFRKSTRIHQSVSTRAFVFN